LRFESARELKAEVLTYLRRQTRLMGVGIACGRRNDDYKIAIRTPTSGTNNQIIAEICRRALGEIDLSPIVNVVTSGNDEWLPTDKAPILRMGVSVGHHRHGTGSLGFFARRQSDGVEGFVSCNHVIALSDDGCDGDEVLCPGVLDGGESPQDVAGYLDGAYPRLHDDLVRVDCAFAQLASNVQYEHSFAAAFDNLAAPAVRPKCDPMVQKIGRSTSHTYGRVSAVDVDYVDVDHIFGKVNLSGQIEIESADDTQFSRPGDSGSLIIDEDARPIGLLYASDYASRRAYANPIADVLEALDVDILL
jgi:hypothetical protein